MFTKNVARLVVGRRRSLRSRRCIRAGRRRHAERCAEENHRCGHADRARPSLFVVNSAGAKLDGGKLTMTDVAANSIVFADRPVRAAGHVTTEQFVMQWDEDKGSFAKNPPNATISVLGGDGSKVEDAVVTLRSPKIEAGNLTFDVSVLEGSLSGGADPRRCSSTPACSTTGMRPPIMARGMPARATSTIRACIITPTPSVVPLPRRSRQAIADAGMQLGDEFTDRGRTRMSAARSAGGLTVCGPSR